MRLLIAPETIIPSRLVDYPIREFPFDDRDQVDPRERCSNCGTSVLGHAWQLLDDDREHMPWDPAPVADCATK